MKKHPNQVTVNNATPKELAKAIRKTDYNYQKEVFKELATGYVENFEADHERGRLKLSSELCVLSRIMIIAEMILDNIWKICKPYMKTKKPRL